MKSEQVRTLTNTALERLTNALDAGQSDALTTFLRVAARFHHYSFRNVMLIAMQRPDATRVAGFHAWRKLARFVKRGEKGVAIIAPMPFRKNDQATDDAEADTGIRFKAVYVFDIAQTDGEPLPELSQMTGDPHAHMDRLKAHVAAQGIALDYAGDLEGADGQSSGRRITLRTGLSAAEEFSVLVHELAHEQLHHIPDAPRLPKVVRETEAEAVAFIVSEAIGLTTGTAATDYIQLYQGSRETLEASLLRVQQTAAGIIQALTDASDDTDEPRSANRRPYYGVRVGDGVSPALALRHPSDGHPSGSEPRQQGREEEGGALRRPWPCARRGPRRARPRRRRPKPGSEKPPEAAMGHGAATNTGLSVHEGGACQ